MDNLMDEDFVAHLHVEARNLLQRPNSATPEEMVKYFSVEELVACGSFYGLFPDFLGKISSIK